MMTMSRRYFNLPNNRIKNELLQHREEKQATRVVTDPIFPQEDLVTTDSDYGGRLSALTKVFATRPAGKRQQNANILERNEPLKKEIFS